MKIYTLLDESNIFYGTFNSADKAKQAIIDSLLKDVNVFSVPDDFIYREALLDSQGEDEKTYELMMKRYAKYLKEQELEDLDFHIVELELNELFNPEED